ncbi:MAG: radical SAM protein [Clostridia bacterium]|nr:radical SAM protein [Clostridia bacterium]
MNKAKKHANIPIFIPHEGCPNDCVFCNQRKITGTTLPADRDIRPEIEEALCTIDPDIYDTEIAFFGGSFTGICRSTMERLLADAYEYVKCGKVRTIRLSTRPDYIDGEILDILSRYGVRHIELGIQSASDKVLSACRRGHTFEQTERACRLINERGFILGGQMMTGLPSSTPGDEIYTAREICRLGAKETRIYPTVVFRETELCNMAQNGEYLPLTIGDAVSRTAECLKIFIRNGVKVLRVGLQSGENLSDPNEVFAGANHPALGELCESAVYLDLIKEKITQLGSVPQDAKTLTVFAPCGETSKISGQKKHNKNEISRILSEMGCRNINIKIKETQLEKYNVDIKFS